MKTAKINQISTMRFNAIGGYARSPMAKTIFEELEYFEAEVGGVLGMLARDITDQDFSGAVFAKDKNLRYRWVDSTGFVKTAKEAKDVLFDLIDKATIAEETAHHQGDELGQPVDFFVPVHDSTRLNPSFVQLSTNDGYSPAKAIIEPMMRWYDDADGNFIEQFQTTGFDQRIWELYLFATFIELGYEINREQPVPDFCCNGLLGPFTVEAVTVGPTIKNGKIVPPPPINTHDEICAYLKQYMPIKFGSPLFTKLQKKYWEKPNVSTAPLIFAIADFSSPMSMIHSQPALDRYLFGVEHIGSQESDGTLTITPHTIKEHCWQGKVIPSGFFNLPGAENVSAVFSSNSGTIAKFNRMGVLGNFGSKQVLVTRSGFMVDHNPDAILPKQFHVIVNAHGYHESWVEGLNVYHNPNALYPLSMDIIPGAAHHFLSDDKQVTSITPHFHPISSTTRHQAPVDVKKVLSEIGDATHIVWTPRPKENS